MEERLLTPAEAAALKGVSRTAVYNAVTQGRLPHQRVLGRIALKESDVAAWAPQGHGGRRNTAPMGEEAKIKLSASQKKRWEARRHRASQE